MSSIEDLFDRYGPAYRWLATGTVMVAAIAVVLSTTIVNVAIPSMQSGLDTSAAVAQSPIRQAEMPTTQSPSGTHGPLPSRTVRAIASAAASLFSM